VNTRKAPAYEDVCHTMKAVTSQVREPRAPDDYPSLDDGACHWSFEFLIFCFPVETPPPRQAFFWSLLEHTGADNGILVS